jgi:asparagine synthase (glutamine-hydrolysing)
MVSDVPICTFLSGGVDSSLVSAICAKELKKQGKRLTTFSFDFVDNDKFFRANPFQPSRDRPYVDQMVRFLDSDHHYLECGNLTQADRLFDSVLAHDLPAMGDIDSSMLQFCSMVREHNKVALTGECADEIFGGYPWFHKKECFEAHTFPWTMDLSPRKSLLDDSFLEYLDMDRYVMDTYERSVAETPVLAEDSPEEARRREIAWLNLRWFMQTLLNRMDRTSMYSGLEARVPFADHRIIEYVWNVPWDMKTRDGLVKNLLRQSGKGLLPDEILFRKKSPYPKTYDTAYEKLLADRVREMMDDSHSPVMDFLDRKKLVRFLTSPSDYGKPWYGQLMAGPQMLAYILQVNFWLKTYDIEVVG